MTKRIINITFTSTFQLETNENISMESLNERLIEEHDGFIATSILDNAKCTGLQVLKDIEPQTNLFDQGEENEISNNNSDSNNTGL